MSSRGTPAGLFRGPGDAGLAFEFAGPALDGCPARLGCRCRTSCCARASLPACGPPSNCRWGCGGVPWSLS
eukprot:5143419-Pyramimonas_sp.AAC.1